MRTLAFRRRMVGLPVTIVAALSLLLQVAVAPGVFSAPPDTLLAICHAATGNDGDRAPQPLPGHGCDHCVLCRAGAVSLLLPPPEPPLPAQAVAVVPAAPLPVEAARGAGWPAYASRAPPTIG